MIQNRNLTGRSRRVELLPAFKVLLIACLGQPDGPSESRHRRWGGPGTEPIPMRRPDVLLLEGDELGHAMLYR
jgi:hypothetical protein